MLRFTRRAAVRVASRLGLASPLGTIAARQVRVIHEPKQTVGRVYNLLALQPARYRDDLALLASSGRYRIFELPIIWQNRLYGPFLRDAPNKEYFFPRRQADGFERARDQTKDFVAQVLGRICKSRGIDAVLSAALHYHQDYLAGIAAHEYGTPFIVLHRENLHPAKGFGRRVLQERWSAVEPFPGTHVIVHNEPMKSELIKSGFIKPDQISALGCMRMDGYVRRIAATPKVGTTRHNRVALFSFTYGVGLAMVQPWTEEPGRTFKDLFRLTHVAFAEAARALPGIEFVIKPKWISGWADRIRDACASVGIDIASIPNLKIDASVNPHDLIMSSDVAVSFGSTTIMEAGIAGIPVIVPLFGEAADPANADRILLFDELAQYQSAADPQTLVSKIAAALERADSEDDQLAKRVAIFERWVSTMDGCATQRYVDCIETVLVGSTPRTG